MTGILTGKTASLLEAVDPRYLEFIDPQGIAVLDDAGFGGGPSHVEGNDVGLPGFLPDPGGSQGSSCGSGFDQTNGILAGRLGGSNSPVGKDDVEPPSDAKFGKPFFQYFHVPANRRHGISIGHGGGSAFVLAHLGGHLGGKRYGKPGTLGQDRVAEHPLMSGIAEGVQKGDSGRFHPESQELVGSPFCFFRRERN